MRTLWIVIGVVLLVLVILVLGGTGIFFMMPRLGAMMNGGRFGPRTFGYMGFGLGLIGWLVRCGLLALLIAGIAWVVSWFARSGRAAALTAPSAASQSPLDVLKMRYARGEITKEQYEQLKRDLESV